MKITSEGEIQISIQEIVERMDEESAKSIIKTFCTSRQVIEWVFDYICGEDKDGWWTSDDHQMRERVLARAERAQVGNPSKHKWTLIDSAVKRLKELSSDKQLYWALYHHPERRTTTIEAFLEGKDKWNEFYTTAADEKIAEVVGIVKSAMEAFK